VFRGHGIPRARGFLIGEDDRSGKRAAGPCAREVVVINFATHVITRGRLFPRASPDRLEPDHSGAILFFWVARPTARNAAHPVTPGLVVAEWLSLRAGKTLPARRS